MKSRPVVTITRKWHNPQIYTVVNDKSISLEIDLDDFVKALIVEFGSPTFILTKAQFEQKMTSSVEAVITGVKEESIKVVT